jgi:hypothetical protein
MRTARAPEAGLRHSAGHRAGHRGARTGEEAGGARVGADRRGVPSLECE